MKTFRLNASVSLCRKDLSAFSLPAGTPVRQSIFGGETFWLADDSSLPSDIRDLISEGVGVGPEFVDQVESLPALPVVELPIILALEKLANQTENPFALDAQALLHRIKNHSS